MNNKKSKIIIALIISITLILIIFIDDYFYNKNYFKNQNINEEYFHLFNVIIPNPDSTKIITSNGKNRVGYRVSVWKYNQLTINELKLISNKMDKTYVKNKLDFGKTYFIDELENKGTYLNDILKDDNMYIYYHKYSSFNIVREELLYDCFSMLIIDLNQNKVYEFWYNH